jgi:hypothetical protein
MSAASQESRPEQAAPASFEPRSAMTGSQKETGQESQENPPDLDAIARSVYNILKKRLARDRERLLGLS